MANFNQSPPSFLIDGNEGLTDGIFDDLFFTPSGSLAIVDEGNRASAVVSSGQMEGRRGTEGMGFVTGNPIQHQLTSAPRTLAETVQPKKSSNVAKKRPRPSSDRKMSEQQKIDRRERNREHAKRSRIRKKFLLESLNSSVEHLKSENSALKSAIVNHLGEREGTELINSRLSQNGSSSNNGSLPGQGGSNQNGDLIANNPSSANKILDDPDFSFIKALQTAQQNFVVTDPSLPDNPIVYATQGFLDLTGYTLQQVLGRNCRFLQGPETDPHAVEKIRKSIEVGEDMSVCLLNYRVDGSTFWNQFFIAALRDGEGNITNYVGVQCRVSEQYARNVCEKQDLEEQLGDDKALKGTLHDFGDPLIDNIEDEGEGDMCEGEEDDTLNKAGDEGNGNGNGDESGGAV